MRHLGPDQLCQDLASNPNIKAALLANSQLELDAFVIQQSPHIQAHYTHSGEDMKAEDARAAATELWRYIQWLRQMRSSAAPRPTQNIRQRAVEKLAAHPAPVMGSATSAATKHLVHELRVHQIELAMQNEDLRHTQEALELAKARYFNLYDLAPVGYVILSEAGSIEEANLAAAMLLTASRSHLVGVPLTRFILPEDQDVFYHCQRQLWSTGAPQACELRVQRKEREPCWIRLETSLAPASECETPRWRVILSDITERKSMEHALLDSEARYRGLHESLRDPFGQVAMDGRFIDCNALYCQMVGYTLEELRTRRYQDLTPERWHAFEASIIHEQILSRGYSDIYEKEYRRKDGTLIPVEMRTILVRDAVGQPNAMWSIVRDITERKRVEAALHQHATQDELTGASNRRHFFTMAGDELKRARRLQRPLALGLIDLDHLKFLNDTYGHGAGDQALRVLAQVCQQHLREIDVFARLGGDEFVMLLPEATLQQAYDALERIRLTLATQPIELAGARVAITFSAGIAGWRGESESLETLLERADHVLYQTKKAGRSRVGVEAAREFPEHRKPYLVAPSKTPPPAIDAERRHHPRRAVTCGIQLRVIDGSCSTTAPGSHHAIARDLNERGVQLVVEQPHPVQTSLMLAIADDANGWERLTLQVGTVVWAHPLSDESRCALGIQFSKPEPYHARA